MVRTVTAFTTLVLAGLVSAGYAQNQSASQGTWQVKTPMPATGGEVAAAVVGDRLYALGGSDRTGATSINGEYDPAIDKWRSRAAAIGQRCFLERPAAELSVT
jgi:hypothetical protein